MSSYKDCSAIGQVFPRRLYDRAAPKLKSLFLDKDLNLWLCPQLGYLSSSPALDPAVRNSLYELWNSVPVRHIFFQLLPRDSRLEYRWGYPHHLVCDLGYPFWRSPPHRSFIQSVRIVRECHGFIIQSFPFVLPEGYNLTEIGVNEQELRKQTNVGVWMQLVAPEDDEFYIRIKGPNEYPHEYLDEDFSEEVNTMEENHHGDGDSDEGDDDYSQEGDEDTSDIAFCLGDIKVPLQDLLEDLYPGFGGVL